MAAPTPVPRTSPPGGIILKDGFRSLFTINDVPAIEFYEKELAPPGVDGGDPIPITTMHNVTWRTMVPRALKTLTPFTITAGYDPIVFSVSAGKLTSLINVPTTGTFRWADGSTLAFYCFVQKFDPQQVKEGEMPEIQITICPTNYDFTNKVEAGPVLTSVAGT